jgi:ABC-type transporter Mla subunit MlaD
MGLFQNGTNTMDVLYPDRDLVAQLVDQLGRVTAAIGDRSAAIDAIANQGVTALRALAQRDQSLAATLDALPSTLQQVKQTSQTVGDVSSRSTPVVLNLAAATRELRPAVQDLAPSATAGRGLLYELGGAAPKLTDTLNSLKNLSNTLPDALGPTNTTFCQLDPALRYIQPRFQELWQIITALGSGSNNYDALGHMVELTPMFDQGSLAGTPPAFQTAAHQLLESGLFTSSELRSYEPFIPNGQIGKIVATGGTPGTQDAYATDPNTTYGGGKYPRVQADC